MARTVDHISDGRLILGIGSGWFEKDYDEYGYEFGTAGTRLDDLGRGAAADRAAAGQAQPARRPGKIPVLIGGGGEKKTLRIVAQHADIWHGFGDAEAIARKTAVLDDWCAQRGPRPRGDRALRRACTARTPAASGRAPATTSASACSPSGSAAPTTTSARCATGRLARAGRNSAETGRIAACSLGP